MTERADVPNSQSNAKLAERCAKHATHMDGAYGEVVGAEEAIELLREAAVALLERAAPGNLLYRVRDYINLAWRCGSDDLPIPQELADWIGQCEMDTAAGEPATKEPAQPCVEQPLRYKATLIFDTETRTISGEYTPDNSAPKGDADGSR